MSSAQPERFRCFFAIALPSALARTVADHIAYLRQLDDGAVRWTPSTNLHVTIRFLGEIGSASFTAAQEFLQTGPMVNDPQSRFRVRIGPDVDAFPSLRRPSVIVLPVQGLTPADAEIFLALQRRTENFARRLGLEPDTRPFRPHVTLGRLRRNRDIPLAIKRTFDDVSSVQFGESEGEIDALHLVRSVLTSGGSQYSTVATLHLLS